ncbi:helix-hairpin-helix domain-containing protein [Halolactibacillus sp. JCM 19043]|uniref:ComEA family DNA-binding protein n=1 Tax=Halolactibacillus sp. JCM 19043 TaxID=1460638 RepID=UPI0007866EF3|nr:helix-hairpin-helix domain-containing protein [Halolactibacillus sp. JCM 19043]
MYQTSQHGDVVFQSDGQKLKLIEANDYPTTPVVTKDDSTNETKEDTTVAPPVQSPAPDAQADDTTNKQDVQSGACVDINTASKEELMTIIHIGEERADQLIKLRPFDSVDQLTRIKGIAAGRLKDIKTENKACVR